MEPTSNGAGSPHACVGWATEAPVRMEAVRGHSPGGGPVVGLWCIPRCLQKGGGAHLLGPDGPQGGSGCSLAVKPTWHGYNVPFRQ